MVERPTTHAKPTLPVRGREAPLLGGLDGLLVQTKHRIERPDDLHVADGAVLVDHTFHEHGALNLRAHRVGGVLRFDLVHHDRKGDPSAAAFVDGAGLRAG